MVRFCTDLPTPDTDASALPKKSDAQSDKRLFSEAVGIRSVRRANEAE